METSELLEEQERGTLREAVHELIAHDTKLQMSYDEMSSQCFDFENSQRKTPLMAEIQKSRSAIP